MPSRDYGPDPFRRGESEEQFLRKMIIWVVGMVIAAACLFGVATWYQRFVVRTATESMAKTTTAIQKQAQDMAAQAQARAEREKAERAEAKRRQEEAEANRIAALNAEAARREASWAKFYVPSPFCKNPDNRNTMECANEHLRAKKEFDKKWAAGELR
jgi:lysophospholipid acyltransferase (LPLAT)-like uncharacterized protein